MSHVPFKPATRRPAAPQAFSAERCQTPLEAPRDAGPAGDLVSNGLLFAEVPGEVNAGHKRRSMALPAISMFP